jgi:hypothetical protein
VFPPVGSLSSDRLLVLVTLGWLGLVTVPSPCSAQLSFKHGCSWGLYTIEQRLVTAFWLHERPYFGDTMETVKVKFRDRFGVEPPRKATMLGREKRAFATGSVKDCPRGGKHATPWRHR